MLAGIRQSIRFAAPVVAVAVLVGTSPVAMAAPAQAKKQQAAVSVPVVGSGTAGTFTGALNLTSFAVQNGQVVALGTVTGVLTNAAGAVTSIVQAVTVPVSVAQATCDILHLDLGPLALDILGLQVNLSRVILDVTAQAGAGNLLGNLLCSVAGLLDSPGGLARLLNDLLGILG